MSHRELMLASVKKALDDSGDDGLRLAAKLLANLTDYEINRLLRVTHARSLMRKMLAGKKVG